MAWGNTLKLKTGVVIAAVLAISAAAFFFVLAAEDRVTDDLVSRVDRFGIPATWTLESEIVRPERFLCMDTNPCPSIYRRWNAGKELTPADIEAVGAGVGFTMTTEGTCQRRSNDIGPTVACSSSGSDGQYDYIMNVTDRDGTEPHLVVLSVRPDE